MADVRPFRKLDSVPDDRPDKGQIDFSTLDVIEVEPDPEEPEMMTPGTIWLMDEVLLNLMRNARDKSENATNG